MNCVLANQKTKGSSIYFCIPLNKWAKKWQDSQRIMGRWRRRSLRRSTWPSAMQTKLWENKRYILYICMYILVIIEGNSCLFLDSIKLGFGCFLRSRVSRLLCVIIIVCGLTFFKTFHVLSNSFHFLTWWVLLLNLKFPFIFSVLLSFSF